MEHRSFITINLLVQPPLLLFIPLVLGVSFIDYPSANVSISWLNYPSTTWKFSDGTFLRPLLALGKGGYPDFAFGFFNNGTANTYYLTILKLPNKVDSTFTNYTFPPVILWSANGDYPMKENATLQLNDDYLLLKDVDGNPAWSKNISTTGSANVSRPSIARMELSSDGNVKLVNGSNGVIWQSFDHPTNTWLPGQLLRKEQRIYSSTSKYNLARGLFTLRPSLKKGAILAFVGTWASRQLYRHIFKFNRTKTQLFGIGSFNHSGNYVMYEAGSKQFQYMRLEPDGYLNVFRYAGGYRETLHADLFEDENFGECAYPMVCGRYGVCNNLSCTCAGEGAGDLYFGQLNASQANLGCEEVNPLKCQDSRLHTFLELSNVSYFRFYDQSISNVDPEICKAECLKNCSCKAVAFRYQDDITIGDCSFQREIYSLMATAGAKKELSYKAITFIKVQTPRSQKKKSSPLALEVLIPSILAGLTFFVFLGACYYIVVKRRSKKTTTAKDKSSIYASTLVRKFSFDALKAATQDFEVKLGEGGFGSVFKGTLADATKIAVKQLNHQGTKDFVVEVETIGRVHHVNLVKLIGYCAQSSNKLLVYEYLVNGSLDSWIFNKNQAHALNWDIRRQIIVGIAKGLEYLHVHCNPRIIHFDIKPQNILLDEEFNVKIADFGLARVIGRNTIQTSITPKGTPGYMAPELIRGRNVSVKVDVYSYGIVVLEVVCGRRYSDYSQGEFLIEAVKRKAKEGRLVDLVDDCNEDMLSHREEAVKAMELAIRCVQPYNARPSMSTVVKVLEGFLHVDPLTDYSFLGKFIEEQSLVNDGGLTSSLMDSVLSGPR